MIWTVLNQQRDDVAKALALLVDREDAASLAIDIVGGETPIEEGLDATIQKGETDFLGWAGELITLRVCILRQSLNVATAVS